MSLIVAGGVEKRKSNSILKAENSLNQNQKTKKAINQIKKRIHYIGTLSVCLQTEQNYNHGLFREM